MSEKNILFHLDYKTWDNENLVIQYGYSEESLKHQLNCHSYDGNHWSAILNLKTEQEIWYRYAIRKNEEITRIEQGDLRNLKASALLPTCYINDSWRSKDRKDSIFFSSAFKDVIFHRSTKNTGQDFSPKANFLTISLHAVNIPKKYALGVTGNTPFLGNWVEPQILSDKEFPIWKSIFELETESLNIEYKFVICDPKTKHILKWEGGQNRKINISLPASENCQFNQNDEIFNYDDNWWRGSGIAIPVFSLRSKNSFGIGEFSDLKLMIDLAASAHMDVVQVLPVNDTIARKTWQDSYPYSAISIFALHPLYINIEEIASFKNKVDQESYEKEKTILNSYNDISFEEVLGRKMFYFRILFAETKTSFERKKDFKNFLSQNESWLKSYSVFCALRDRNGTPDFNLWPKYQLYNDVEISKLIENDSAIKNEVLFYSFLQYHAHLQLKSSNEYGKKNGVVLKGDLPIGIYRYSADAWVSPHLFNMEEQAGAPPDAYAVLGQNWGFPTYKWSEMAKNNFEWWKQRMVGLGKYFDAIRIDHILGFFRIWQIPIHQVQGTLGLFNPRIPYTREELTYFGIFGDLNKYTQPFIKEVHLKEIFGADMALVKTIFLTEVYEETYFFKEEFSNQKLIHNYILASKNKKLEKHAQNILSLFSDVLLIEEPDSANSSFNPRITLQTTRHYKSLDPHQQNLFDKLYVDYFYRRHDAFWKAQALWKIPALLEATNMFICGEDLGMIPDSVPEVMQKLNIIPLEIQRMPKGQTSFGIVNEYPYYSVCSPSCHDMSTIRGWWESNNDLAQRFFNQYMHRNGQAPEQAGIAEVEFIIKDHLNSNSILAIFPIQDLLGMDNKLKRKKAGEEQINDPSNPNHNWKYRMHLNIEDILADQDFISKIKSLVITSGRGA